MALPSRARMRWMWRFHNFLWDASGGRLGAELGGMKVLELTTTGHRSGEPRRVLLYYIESTDGPLLAGSNIGSDSDLAWIQNLRANPTATVRVGGAENQVGGRFLEGEERDQAYGRFAHALPDYARYQDATDRVIPVVVMESVRG